MSLSPPSPGAEAFQQYNYYTSAKVEQQKMKHVTLPWSPQQQDLLGEGLAQSEGRLALQAHVEVQRQEKKLPANYNPFSFSCISPASARCKKTIPSWEWSWGDLLKVLEANPLQFKQMEILLLT